MARIVTGLLLLPILGLAVCHSAEKEAQLSPGIKRVSNVTPQPNAFKAATRLKPIVLRNEKDAAKYFSKKELEKLKKQCDFTKRHLLVFAWKGSGQDRLTYNVAESFPEQIHFIFKPGRTRDLRSHVSIFSLRNKVTFRVKLR